MWNCSIAPTPNNRNGKTCRWQVPSRDQPFVKWTAWTRAATVALTPTDWHKSIGKCATTRAAAVTAWGWSVALVCVSTCRRPAMPLCASTPRRLSMSKATLRCAPSASARWPTRRRRRSRVALIACDRACLAHSNSLKIAFGGLATTSVFDSLRLFTLILFAFFGNIFFYIFFIFFCLGIVLWTSICVYSINQSKIIQKKKIKLITIVRNNYQTGWWCCDEPWGFCWHCVQSTIGWHCILSSNRALSRTVDWQRSHIAGI